MQLVERRTKQLLRSLFRLDAARDEQPRDDRRAAAPRGERVCLRLVVAAHVPVCGLNLRGAICRAGGLHLYSANQPFGSSSLTPMRCRPSSSSFQTPLTSASSGWPKGGVRRRTAPSSTAASAIRVAPPRLTRTASPLSLKGSPDDAERPSSSTGKLTGTRGLRGRCEGEFSGSVLVSSVMSVSRPPSEWNQKMHGNCAETGARESVTETRDNGECDEERGLQYHHSRRRKFS